jgi:hypothetical protein
MDKFPQLPSSVTLDRFGMVVWNSSFATAILGNVRTGDYALIDLDKLPLSPDTLLDCRQRNYEFLGVVALHHSGRPAFALDHEFDSEAVAALYRRFLDMLESTVGDSLEWLSRLHGLQDPRNGLAN